MCIMIAGIRNLLFDWNTPLYYFALLYRGRGLVAAGVGRGRGDDHEDRRLAAPHRRHPRQEPEAIAGFDWGNPSPN